MMLDATLGSQKCAMTIEQVLLHLSAKYKEWDTVPPGHSTAEFEGRLGTTALIATFIGL